jgi:hypothetical protein
VRRPAATVLAVLLAAGPALADGPAPGQTPECRSCTARHEALQALQASRAAQRCAEPEADGSPPDGCDPAAGASVDLLPPTDPGPAEPPPAQP